jgi:hypothetical protein
LIIIVPPLVGLAATAVPPLPEAISVSLRSVAVTLDGTSSVVATPLDPLDQQTLSVSVPAG